MRALLLLLILLPGMLFDNDGVNKEGGTNSLEWSLFLQALPSSSLSALLYAPTQCPPVGGDSLV